MRSLPLPCWTIVLALVVVAGNEMLSADEEPCTYYIDATDGDDSDVGTSPGKAWRSLAKVNRATLRPGDCVLFRRGQTWRGQLVPQSGADGRPVTYGAYGEGDKPLLLGSANFSRPDDWQSEGEALWATTPARFDARETVADLNHDRWSLHREGGADCAMTRPAEAAHYRIVCKSPGERRNHLQFSAAGLSVREGEDYQFTYRARSSKPFPAAAIAVMKNGPPWTDYAPAVTSPAPIGTDWTEHTVRFQSQHTADDARLTFFLGGAMPAEAVLEFEPGTFVRAECSQPIPLSVDVGNIIFEQLEPGPAAGGRGTLSVGVKRWQVADLRDEGDYFYDNQRGCVVLRAAANPASRYRSIELALKRHIISQGNRGHITYEDLALRYGAAHGIGGGNTHHITVRRCDISYIGGGHQLTTPDGRPVRYGNGVEFWDSAANNLVEDCRLWEIYDAALTNQGSGVNVQENITYRRNVIWNSEYSFEYWNRPAESITRNIVFEYNTCVDAGCGWGHDQRPDRNGRHLMFYHNPAATKDVIVRHNVFSNATHSMLRLHGEDWASGLVVGANVWHQPNGPILLWSSESIAADGLEAFVGQHGLGGPWLLVDPQFQDPERRDYRPQPDSPARPFGRWAEPQP